MTGPIPLDEPALEKTSERQTNPAPTPTPSLEPYLLVLPQDIEENHQSASITTVSALVEEFRVDAATPGLQRLSSVAALADRSFVITWTASLDDNDASIMAQRFAADGSRLGEVLALAGDDAGQSIFSSIAGRDDGGFVTTWTRGLLFGGDDDDGGIGGSGQRYAAEGMAADEVSTVDEAGDRHASFRSVAALADGGFVVAWMTPDGDGAGIAGQRFDAAGGLAGEAFVVNVTSVGAQAFPAVAGLPGGGFVVTWRAMARATELASSVASSAGRVTPWSARVATTWFGARGGMAGDDILAGGACDDVLWGGPGADTSGSAASVAAGTSRISPPKTATCSSDTSSSPAWSNSMTRRSPTIGRYRLSMAEQSYASIRRVGRRSTRPTPLLFWRLSISSSVRSIKPPCSARWSKRTCCSQSRRSQLSRWACNLAATADLDAVPACHPSAGAQVEGTAASGGGRPPLEARSVTWTRSFAYAVRVSTI